MNTNDELPPQATIDAILDALRPKPGDVQALLDDARAAEAAGVTLAQYRGVRALDLDRLMRIARGLGEAGRWAEAAPIAMHLAVHVPGKSRFSFIAATCFQRLGQLQPASLLYLQSLLAQPDPATSFRLGECLRSMGETGPARQAFGAAVDMCRGHDHRRGLQDLACEALAAL